ncbi:dTDP-4-amino-4,6-dideoxygalactose transaminase [Rubrivirga sp. IMCC45206]|uniref:dTDP-4-amino-4,6-dideoxygalactose transaminase n=1 Tax=Rubrivirga sp. IMCC45206 TaxID=3391614 RepID=UPI00398F9B30
MIPFSKPSVGPAEQAAVAAALGNDVLHGDGAVSRRVQAKLREWLGVEHALLTTSCTHAIEVAMLALGLGPGDEVILPSFTFVSTANPVVLRGATPVFADVDLGTMNLDPEDVARRVTPRTRAIIPVHYGGVACDMDALQAIADQHDLVIVEDAAQGVDATYKGRPLGTIGDIGCYSFHDTKNLMCGEGGAYLTNSDELARKAELVREKGTNRAAFLRGDVDKYTWVSLGSSYIQSDVLAALLEAQLDRRDEIKRQRMAVWDAYRAAFAPLVEAGRVSLQTIPEGAAHNAHLFYFRTETPELRGAAIDALRAAGLQAVFHYVPLHSSPFGRENGCDYDLPATTLGAETLVRLPLFPDLAPQAGEVAARAVEAVDCVVRSVSAI